jgi:hypothetical protein
MTFPGKDPVPQMRGSMFIACYNDYRCEEPEALATDIFSPSATADIGIHSSKALSGRGFCASSWSASRVNPVQEII